MVRCEESSEKHAVPRKIRELLNQPFMYLAKGKQSYVFVSMDKKYVLKFFKKKDSGALEDQTEVSGNPILGYFHKKKLRKEKQKKKRLELSQALALTDLREETGVEYIHLQRCGLKGSVLLLDPRGEVLHVEVDTLQFIIQHTIAPLKETFVKLMHANQIEEAKLKVHAIFDLLENCCKKSIWDRDTGLIQNGNIGFLESRAVYIDTGRLAPFKKGSSYITYDLKRLKPLGKWLSANYPALAVVFEQRYNDRKKIIIKS